jgi:CRISPR-associated protein Cmr4
MYEQAVLLGLYAETPLHPGTGQALGAVDLPVQRERHTGYPLIPGSSLKGVLRAAAESKLSRDDPQVSILFGPPNERASEHAGALGVSDARILLFPVRSLFGVFAWITCPLVLERFRRDAALAGLPMNGWPEPALLQPDPDQALIAPDSAVARDRQVTLEEFTFQAQPQEAVQQAAQLIAAHVFPALAEYEPWKARLARHLVVLPDNEFADFVRFATEVVARIALNDETKTTSGDGGNLWYEEQLPSETVMYSLLLASPPRRRSDGLQSAADVLAELDRLALERLQIGGDETVGRGIVAVRLAQGGAGASAGAIQPAQNTHNTRGAAA